MMPAVVAALVFAAVLLGVAVLWAVSWWAGRILGWDRGDDTIDLP